MTNAEFSEKFNFDSYEDSPIPYLQIVGHQIAGEYNIEYYLDVDDPVGKATAYNEVYGWESAYKTLSVTTMTDEQYNALSEEFLTWFEANTTKTPIIQ
ncbi:MAG: hypothetical protein MJ072_00430 [Clostridia bacterium]|nr:hypothetical protein [Clostridia bacterium]